MLIMRLFETQTKGDSMERKFVDRVCIRGIFPVQQIAY